MLRSMVFAEDYSVLSPAIQLKQLTLQQIFEKNSSARIFPVKHSREIFKPGAIIFDFGSGSRLEWGHALLSEYPGITYLAVDLNDNFKDRILRFMKRRSLPKSQRNRLRFVHSSYLEIIPQNIGRADVITINSPFCTTYFLNEVKKKYFTSQLKSCIKPGGKIIIYTEWIESGPIKGYPSRYDLVSIDNARIVIKQALEKAFGVENVYEDSDPLPGYLPEDLLVYKNIREIEQRKKRGEESIDYKASFLMVDVPEQISAVQVINKKVVTDLLRSGLQKLKEIGIKGSNNRVVSINPGWPSEFEKLEKELDSNSLSWEWIAYSAGSEVIIVEPDEQKNKRWQEVAWHVKSEAGKITVIPASVLKEFSEEILDDDIDAILMHTNEGKVLLYNKKESRGKLNDFLFKKLLFHVSEFDSPNTIPVYKMNESILNSI